MRISPCLGHKHLHHGDHDRCETLRHGQPFAAWDSGSLKSSILIGCRNTDALGRPRLCFIAGTYARSQGFVHSGVRHGFDSSEANVLSLPAGCHIGFERADIHTRVRFPLRCGNAAAVQGGQADVRASAKRGPLAPEWWSIGSIFTEIRLPCR